jgi:hypothetical protein
MTTNNNAKVAKSCNKFYCENCQYGTMRKSSFDKHNLTAKHMKTTINNAKVAKSCDIIYSCNNCEKYFKDRPGLWRHKKKCTAPLNVIQTCVDKDIIMSLIKENSELKNIMMEVIKNGTNTTINSNNTNSNNKTFNLQFFLHETCKDAMNIMDFVDSIKLQLTDLEKVGSIGYVEGISNIITTNLKALDVTQRPIHCTDNKREILYVKDEDKWEKENDEKNKLRKAIKHIAHKNSKLILEFKNTYPDCIESHSKKSDQYNKLIIEAMGGLGDNDLEKEDKIIKKITKEVTIYK